MLCLTTSLLLAAGCQGAQPRMPDDPESIAGRITAVQRSGERIGGIRVEAQPEDAGGSAKAAVRITQRTVLIDAASRGSVDFNALRVGQWVRAWFVGPVRESYPVQADAGTVVIDSIAVR